MFKPQLEHSFSDAKRKSGPLKPLTTISFGLLHGTRLVISSVPEATIIRPSFGLDRNLGT